MSAVNLPRARRGVLRPRLAEYIEDGEIIRNWWVHDDVGPIDGPHATADATWDRVVEIDASDARDWEEKFLASRKGIL
jgi:hypothetical protein